jgi:hypothetical protein
MSSDGDQAGPAFPDLRVIATVLGVEMLGRRALSVLPIGFDIRFAVTVRIESVTPDHPWLSADTERIFGVHSPGQSGLGDWKKPPIGERFELRLTGDGTGWISLQAYPPPAASRDAPDRVT